MNKRKLISTFPKLPKNHRYTIVSGRTSNPVVTVKIKKWFRTASRASGMWYYDDPDGLRTLAHKAYKRLAHNPES